ncbi:MAG TPA: hypothetical protein VHM70_07575, partial [Polyangiaceae bacterium]|nr:hypothetical protein [Polyangiaceae bacterium]
MTPTFRYGRPRVSAAQLSFFLLSVSAVVGCGDDSSSGQQTADAGIKARGDDTTTQQTESDQPREAGSDVPETSPGSPHPVNPEPGTSDGDAGSSAPQAAADAGPTSDPSSGETGNTETPPVCGNGVVESGETCDPLDSCPTSCNDGNACTTDSLSGATETCDVACAFTVTTQCVDDDLCCPEGCDANTDSDCSASCGNGTLEPGETCDPAENCPAACDDGNSCTADTVTGSAANCNTACSHAAIVNCVDGDGCCAAGCTTSTDDDCSAACGNDVTDPGETCDPPDSCPASCDDGNACTTDLMTGST